MAKPAIHFSLEVQRSFVPLHQPQSEQPRLLGTESSSSDFHLLLTQLAAKFSAEHSLTYEPRPLQSDEVVVFLDFDGVCWVDPLYRPHEKYRKLENDRNFQTVLSNNLTLLKRHYDFDDKDEFLSLCCWDPAHVQRIHALCTECNARIVVSSSWRNGRSHYHLKNLLDLWGLGSFYLGKTVDGRWKRANEIQSWLDQNPQVARFLIVDDQYVDEFTEHFPDAFVHCHPLKGFDDEPYQKAVSILKDTLWKQCMQ